MVADGIQQIQVFHAAFAFYDAVDDAVKPARAFSARRTLAARLVVVEVAQTLKGFHHAHVFVHHDNRAGTEHRTCLGNRVVVHVGLHHDIGRQNWRRRTAGNNGFKFFTAAHTARHFQDFGKRRTQWHFIVARALDVAGNTEQFGTACIRNTFIGKCLSAVTDNEWDGGERFGIVDGGRFAIQAE